MKLHKDATVVFSAQFDGQDAAEIVLPHFRALKTAAKGLFLVEFPYPELAFIHTTSVRIPLQRYAAAMAGAE